MEELKIEELKSEERATSGANYVWQPIVAMIFFAVALFFIDWTATNKMLWIATGGALACSAYIVFVFPSSVSARWYNILGGYVFGIVCGELLYWLAVFFEWIVDHTYTLPTVHVYEFTAVIGLLFIIWLMLLFRLNHPPVIIITLAMMLASKNYLLLATALAAAVVLTILKIILASALRDLAE